MGKCSIRRNPTAARKASRKHKGQHTIRDALKDTKMPGCTVHVLLTCMLHVLVVPLCQCSKAHEMCQCSEAHEMLCAATRVRLC
jgi:hypothetical protein